MPGRFRTRGATPRLRRSSCSALAFGLAGLPPPAAAACDPDARTGSALTGCLTGAATRTGAFDSQAMRLRFRNAECRNVVPFEGRPVRTLHLNAARIAPLASRYPEAR